jgi:hypothetical protein
MSFKASDEAIKMGLGVHISQEEKQNMKEFYKDKIMALEAQISDLKKYNGISLRDHFAGLAMQKIIDSYDAPIGKLTIVKEAYEWADAMLVERNKDERNTLLDK